MAYVDLYVRAPEPINNPGCIKRIDDELMMVAPACFLAPPPSGTPIQEVDGTWSVRVMFVDKIVPSHVTFVKRILGRHDITVEREEPHDE